MYYLLVNINNTVSIIYDTLVYQKLPDEIKQNVIIVDKLPEKGEVDSKNLNYALMYNTDLKIAYWQLIEPEEDWYI